MNPSIKSIVSPEAYEIIDAAHTAAHKVIGNDLDGLDEYIISRIGADDAASIVAEVYNLLQEALVSSINQFGVITNDEDLRHNHLSELTKVLEVLIGSEEAELSESIVRAAQEELSANDFLVALTVETYGADEDLLHEVLYEVPESWVTKAVTNAERVEEMKSALVNAEAGAPVTIGNTEAIHKAILLVTVESGIVDYFRNEGKMGHTSAEYLSVFGGELAEVADEQQAAVLLFLLGLYADIDPDVIPAVIGRYVSSVFTDEAFVVRVTANLKRVKGLIYG